MLDDVLLQRLGTVAVQIAICDTLNRGSCYSIKT